jgi:hypothetical protein
VKNPILAILLAAMFAGCGSGGPSISADSPAASTAAVGETALRGVVEKALASGRRVGKYGQVTSGDLIALALHHGGGELPSDLWGVPGWDSENLRGTAQFGPWGMSLEMARTGLGAEYGIDARWTELEVAEFLMARPVVQAQLAAERLQRLYSSFGPRSPYALQSWMLPTFPPNGEAWREESAKLQSEPMPFARAILLGTPESPRGMLYWLAFEGHETALRETLLVWKSPSIYVWEYGQPAPRRTAERLTSVIKPSELDLLRPYRREFATVNRLVSEVLVAP